jgi:hypothetical protein
VLTESNLKIESDLFRTIFSFFKDNWFMMRLRAESTVKPTEPMITPFYRLRLLRLLSRGPKTNTYSTDELIEKDLKRQY